MDRTPTLDELLAEEEQSVLAGFDFSAAWRLGVAVRALAEERQLPVAVAVEHSGALVFLSLLPGSTTDNFSWLGRKQAVVRRFHHSSLYMRLLCEQRGKPFNERYRLPEADFAASGGAVPIAVRGVGVVGSLAVSGLADIEDHRLGMQVLRNCG